MSDFHSFYEAVEEAKTIYLRSSVKDEAPKFVEIDCDSVRFDDVAASVIVKVESSAVSDVDIREPSEYDTPQDHEDSGSTNLLDFGNNSEDSDSEKCAPKLDEKHEPKLDEAVASAAAELAIELAAQANDTTCPSAKLSISINKRFDHLISRYMDMHCELCQHPFDTLTDASYHYRSKHHRRTATLKCCQRRIKMPDIRDHIQYHLNPNMFK